MTLITPGSGAHLIGGVAHGAVLRGGQVIWRRPAPATAPPASTTATMSSPDAWPTTGSTVTITKGTSGGTPIGGVLTLDGANVAGDVTDNGSTLVYVVPAGGSADRTLTWTPESGAAVSQTVSASILSRSAVYFDNTDAPLGTVTALTTRGALSRVFSEAAFAGGASAVMQADGLALNGHILRNSTALGTYSRMTILLDVTRRAAPVSGAGELVAINSNGVAAARFWLRYTTTNFQIMGPNGVAINFAQIGGYGDRQVIAAAIDLTAGVMTAVDVDGIEQSAAVATGPISITRVEIGKACLATIHRCAIILEA